MGADPEILLDDKRWLGLEEECVDRGADLRQFSPRDLDNIANRINTRPRRVLECATSAELYRPCVRAQSLA